MKMKLYFCVSLLILATQWNKCVCFVWEEKPCSTDPIQEMLEGIQPNVGRFPWLGVLQHSFQVAGKQTFAITGAILIHSTYALAAAEDVSRISRELLLNNTKLILWKSATEKFALDVHDYVLHPEFVEGTTTASIALLDLVPPAAADFSDYVAPVRPICLPVVGAGIYENIFAVKLTDVTGELQKEVYRMHYVNREECEMFYFEAEVTTLFTHKYSTKRNNEDLKPNNLNNAKMNPTAPVCAQADNGTSPCVWDSGIALITRQSWGFWQLIGFGARGPGCGAPAKFMNIHVYLPWIHDLIVRTVLAASTSLNKLAIRRVSTHALVMYDAFTPVQKTFGQCEKMVRGRVLFKDYTEIGANKNFAQGFYILIVSESSDFLCAEVNLQTKRQTEASIWVEHACHRDMEGVQPAPRSGDLRKLECFVYYKSTAFIEVRFQFSFKAVLSVTFYGKMVTYKEISDPFKQTQATTSWWPTHSFRTVQFAPILRPNWVKKYYSGN